MEPVAVMVGFVYHFLSSYSKNKTQIGLNFEDSIFLMRRVLKKLKNKIKKNKKKIKIN